MVSEGVTAKMASITPAPSPASRLRGGETLPSPTDAHQSRSRGMGGGRTYLSVRKRVLEVVVRHEAYAGLHGVACTVSGLVSLDPRKKTRGDTPMTNAMHPE